MTTATDGAAILAAILADPADDLSRLAYADWLKEQGDGFVRCDLAFWLKHGPALVRSHPVTRVELSGVEPWEGRDEPSTPVEYWGWWRDHEYQSERPWVVPAAVIHVLAEDARRKKTPQPYDAHDNSVCVMFDSAALALDALSDALVLWAKETPPG